MRKPFTPIALALFFVFGTLMTALAGASILDSSGPLAQIWHVKPDEYRRLRDLAPWSGIGFLLLSGVMAATVRGCLRRKRWGWRLAVLIFTANAFGDALRIPAGSVWEGATGLIIAGLVLVWLWRAPVRALFT